MVGPATYFDPATADELDLETRMLVERRGWLTEADFNETLALCQSLPGPLAIQVGIYIAWLRCGFWGAWAGGWSFILPNFVIVAVLGALYVHLGDLKAVTGIKGPFDTRIAYPSNGPSLTMSCRSLPTTDTFWFGMTLGKKFPAFSLIAVQPRPPLIWLPSMATSFDASR